ncbi:MAG: hypothetical protein ACRC4M_04175 [Mycoplasma sp.]
MATRVESGTFTLGKDVGAIPFKVIGDVRGKRPAVYFLDRPGFMGIVDFARNMWENMTTHEEIETFLRERGLISRSAKVEIYEYQMRDIEPIIQSAYNHSLNDYFLVSGWASKW